MTCLQEQFDKISERRRETEKKIKTIRGLLKEITEDNLEFHEQQKQLKQGVCKLIGVLWGSEEGA